MEDNYVCSYTFWLVYCLPPAHLIALEETFSLIRNAKGVVAVANNRIPQSFVKSGNRRANRKLSVPRRENLQISYLAPFLPSCHYNQRTMRSLHFKLALLVLLRPFPCPLSLSPSPSRSLSFAPSTDDAGYGFPST